MVVDGVRAMLSSIPGGGGREVQRPVPEHLSGGRTGAPPAEQDQRVRHDAPEARSAKDGPSQAEILKAVDDLNQTALVFDKGLRFNLHEASQRHLVQVVNRETDEIIREIPPEKILDLVASIDDMLGLLVDERG